MLFWLAERRSSKRASFTTGIDINEVSNLDVAQSSYTVDFYLWFRYQERFEDQGLEIAFYFAYGLFVAELVMAILIHRSYRAGDERREGRLQRMGQAGYPSE